jgi:hypothetical protein
VVLLRRGRAVGRDYHREVPRLGWLAVDSRHMLVIRPDSASVSTPVVHDSARGWWRRTRRNGPSGRSCRWFPAAPTRGPDDAVRRHALPGGWARTSPRDEQLPSTLANWRRFLMNSESGTPNEETRQAHRRVLGLRTN